ncbi:16876_t:CDS:10, partial [Gigaspora margarita]
MAEDDIDWYFGSLASIPKNGSIALTISDESSSEDSISEDDDSSAEDIVFDLQKLQREQVKFNLRKKLITNGPLNGRVNLSANGSDTSNSSQSEGVPENGSNEQYIEHAIFNTLCPVKSSQRPSVHMLNYKKFKASTKYFSPPDSHIDDGSAWIPEIKRTRLPIESRRDDIVNIIREHKVVVLSGSTGCGKSTQVPQYILDDCLQRNASVNIICTQPRRIAAASLAHRVSSERGTRLRGQVGFHIGGKNGYSSSTRLLYVTTGILLEMLKADRYLKSYTHVIMDEIHERNVDDDLMMAHLCEIMRMNPSLKLIIMSATMNVQKFTDYFREFETEKDGIISEIPWIDVPSKNFPVDVFYLEDVCQGLEVTEAYQTLIMSEPKKPAMMQERRDVLINWIMHCHATCSADEAFLVFLPGISIIAEVEDQLVFCNEQQRCGMTQNDGKLIPFMTVIKLHSTVTIDEQCVAMQRPKSNHRKIILATNVAESSITVPDVRIIFDSCLRKDVYYDKATRCYSLNEQWISKDCAEQRRGRADPPDDTAVDYALEDLETTGAVTKSNPIIRETDDWVQGSVITYEYEVTRLGSILAQLPIDLHSGLLVVYGAIFGSLYDTMIIAAILQNRGVIVQPPNQEIAISAAMKRFHLNLPCEYKLQGGSDLISHLRAYLFWEESTQNDNEFDRTEELNWCQQQFISLYWIREIQDLVITIRESLSYQNICSPPTKQERDKIRRNRVNNPNLIIPDEFLEYSDLDTEQYIDSAIHILDLSTSSEMQQDDNLISETLIINEPKDHQLSSKLSTSVYQITSNSRISLNPWMNVFDRQYEITSKKVQLRREPNVLLLTILLMAAFHQNLFRVTPCNDTRIFKNCPPEFNRNHTIEFSAKHLPPRQVLVETFEKDIGIIQKMVHPDSEPLGPDGDYEYSYVEFAKPAIPLWTHSRYRARAKSFLCNNIESHLPDAVFLAPKLKTVKNGAALYTAGSSLYAEDQKKLRFSGINGCPENATALSPIFHSKSTRAYQSKTSLFFPLIINDGEHKNYAVCAGKMITVDHGKSHVAEHITCLIGPPNATNNVGDVILSIFANKIIERDGIWNVHVNLIEYPLFDVKPLEIDKRLINSIRYFLKQALFEKEPKIEEMGDGNSKKNIPYLLTQQEMIKVWEQCRITPDYAGKLLVESILVDLKRVNMTVIKPWIAQKIVDLLGGEDEVVVNYVFGLLEETDLDPRMMQINLTGFLERNAPIFVTELWKLLLSAQDCESGIPAIFLEQKMEEIRKRKEDDERIMAEIRRRREREDEERAKFREIREKEHRIAIVSFQINFVLQVNLYRIVTRNLPDDVVEVEILIGFVAVVEVEVSKININDDPIGEAGVPKVDINDDRIEEVGVKAEIVLPGNVVENAESIRATDVVVEVEAKKNEEEEDTSKRRRLSKEEVVTKASSEKYSSTPSPRRNYHDQHTGYVVTEDEARKRLDDSVEETDSVQNSPPRKKVVDAPIFKSKWNDDEDEEEIKKTSMSGLEQLEQLRAKAFESMKARK